MTVVMAAALVTGTVAHCCANMFVWTISNVVNVGAVLCIRYYHVHYVSDGTFNAGYGPRRCFWTFRRNYAQDTGFFHKVFIKGVGTKGCAGLEKGLWPVRFRNSTVRIRCCGREPNALSSTVCKSQD